MTIPTFNTIKILILAFSSTIIAMMIGNFLVKYLYKIQFWKKQARAKTIDGQDAEIFLALHREKETTVPRGGGIIIWATVLIVSFICLLLANLTDIWWLQKLNFFSREQTWIPIFALLSASLIGLVDDIFVVYGKGKYIGGGLKFRVRLILVTLIGLIGGCWLYFKLGWSSINVPLLFNFPEGIVIQLGLWYILLYIIVSLASWASGVVDGLDGLAGGVFSAIFGAFAIIALFQGLVDVAAFCAIILGTLFSFLWFNIPPAKFYMGETGILGLTMTMTAVAFITNSIVILPIISGILVIETGSVILQLLSKKFRKKKIWLSTPIHHHLEAIGWKTSQIVMRFWIIAVVLAILGVSIQLLMLKQ
jgi:phospho-N-acetylmuramoyl-pentapeptide-transferase